MAGLLAARLARLAGMGHLRSRNALQADMDAADYDRVAVEHTRPAGQALPRDSWERQAEAYT